MTTAHGSSGSEEDTVSTCSSDYETADEEVADGLPVVIDSIEIVPVLPLSRPTLEECFKKSGILFDCATLNEPIRKTHIAGIAKKITQWRDLFPYFGLEEYEKEEIEAARDLGEQKRKLLAMWTQKFGPRATYRHLCIILWEQYRIDLVETVCEIMASVEVETSSHAPPHSQSALSRFNRKLSDWYAENTLPYFFNPRCYKWMPNVSKAYIHPDIISKEEQKKQPDFHKEAVLRGQQWKITKKGKNKKIQLEELLKVNSDKKCKVVLVEGGPGMGKSTLAWQVCHCWGIREHFDQYSTVLLLPLRDERVQQAKQVEDLFFNLRDRKAQEEVKQEIDTGRDILVILDGLDELPSHLLSKQSIFTDLLSGNVICDATILVTSRPSATQQLLARWNQRISQHFIICGFNTEDIEEYAETILSDEKLKEFISYLSIHPHIQSIMYVPLHSAFVMAVYLQHKQLPKTLTQLYVALVETILSQYLDDHPEYCGKENVSRAIGLELPKLVNTRFIELCKIAFDTVCTQELIFSDETMPKGLHDLGFTDSVPGLYMHRICSYNFLHLSIQEFLAAYHVSLLSSQEQEQLLLRSREEHHFKNMMRFVAGLTKFEGIRRETVKQVVVVKEERTTTCLIFLEYDVNNVDDYGLELLYECQSMSFLDKEDTYFAHLEWWFSQLHHYLALGYCITNSNCTWEIQLDSTMDNSGELCIHLDSTMDNSDELCIHLDSAVDSACTPVGMLIQGLQDCKTQPAYTIKHIEWKEYNDKVDGKLFTQAPAYFTAHIEKLYYMSPLIFGLRTIMFNSVLFFQWLPSCKLNTLYIPRLPSSNIEIVSRALTAVPSLKILDLHGSKFTLQSMQAFVSMLQQNQSLTKVDIEDCGIDIDCACYLARAFYNNTTLTVLNMSENSVGERGALAMAKMLKHNTTLEEVHMHDAMIYVVNPIGVVGAMALVESLAVNQHLKKLYISGKYKNDVITLPTFYANKKRVMWEE